MIEAPVSHVFGDGGQTIWLCTFGNPEGCYIVRIDSSWDINNHTDGPALFDHLDDIYEAIEDEYGSGECAYCGGAYGNAGCRECNDEPESESAFPHFVMGNGVHWGMYVKPVEATPSESTEGQDA